MKKIFNMLVKCCIAGILAICILSVFCMMYLYEGIHITEESGATDYSWEDSQYKATMNEGFAWLKMDKNGYNNNMDYSLNPDILLMGSSHMEGLQVAADKNTGAILNEILPNHRTYNIGISGHTIYRCVDNIDNAIRTYHPKKYLVMVIDTVDLSIEEMNKITNGKATPIPSYDSGIMYYMQKIPAVKALYKQIDEWATFDSLNINNNQYEEITKSEEENIGFAKEYDDSLSKFLDKVSNIQKDADIDILMIYQPAQHIDEDGITVYNHDKEKINIFKRVCDNKDITFIDATIAFEEMYKDEYKLAHGFINTGIGEGHLNEDGHRVIAEVIAKQIREMEGE